MKNEDKILEAIRKDSQKNIEEIREQSRAKCDEINDRAKARIREISEETQKKLDAQSDKLRKAYQSRIELEKRNILLKAKRSEINKTIDAVLEYMNGLPDKEYFELLMRLALTLDNKKGKIFLNSRDLRRAPKSLDVQLNAVGFDVRLSDVPDDSIESGFILKNGDIEDNMCFRSLIAEHLEELEDLINRELFREQGGRV